MVFLLITFITLAVVGLSFVVLGVRVLQKKPFLITGNIWVLIIGVCFLPIFVGLLYKIVRFSFDIHSDLETLISIAFFFLILFYIKKTVGDVFVFNIEEEAMYGALFKVLKDRNISWEEKRTTIVLPALGSEIKISYLPTTQGANIFFRPKSKNSVMQGFANDLKQAMPRTRCGKALFSGLIFVLCGVFMLYTTVGIAVSALSRMASYTPETPQETAGVSLQTFDKNGDGKSDHWIYRDKDNVPLKWLKDSNYDGKIDGWSFFKDGEAFLDENDFDGDGRVDTIYVNIFDFENKRTRGFHFELQNKRKNIFIEQEDTGWLMSK